MANREQKRLYDAARYQANKETIKARVRAWYGAHPKPPKPLKPIEQVRADKSKAGKIGGRSRSDKKILAASMNMRKAIESNTLPGNEAAINRLRKQYKSGARWRKHEWQLSDAVFKELIFSNCHYCGVVPLQTGLEIPIKYNGIDRKDNSVGYLPHNCVPCCRTCNWAKGTESYDRFMEYLARVASFIIGRTGCA